MIYDDDDLDDALEEEDLRAISAGAAHQICSDEDNEEDEDEALLRSVQDQVGSFLKSKEKEVPAAGYSANLEVRVHGSPGHAENGVGFALGSIGFTENAENANGPSNEVLSNAGSASPEFLWHAENGVEGSSAGNDVQDVHVDAGNDEAVHAESGLRAIGGFPFSFWGGDHGDDSDVSDGTPENLTNLQLLRLALKRNRDLKEKLEGMLSKVRERQSWNQDLQKRASTLVKLEKHCKRKLNAKPNFQLTQFVSYLISGQYWGRRLSPGPEKNPDVDGYLMLQARPTVVTWSDEETAAMRNAVKKQVQQELLLGVMRDDTNEDLDLDARVETIENMPDEEVKRHLDVVDWSRVALTSGVEKSAEECKARWWRVDLNPTNTGPWTKEEDKQLLALAAEFELREWATIAARLGTGRTPAQCLMRYQRSLNGNMLRREWTPEEDELLQQAVLLCGEMDWEAVASCLQGRLGPQCRIRWDVVNPALKQAKKVGRWSVDEDKRLKWAVLILGPKEWKKIAGHVPGRSYQQCRERWCNVLDPGLKHGSWDQSEDERLAAAVAVHGSHHWAAVAEIMKPRTDNQCKRRWLALHPEVKDEFHKEARIKKTCFPRFGKRVKERPELEIVDFAVGKPELLQETAAAAAKKKKPRKSKWADGAEGGAVIAAEAGDVPAETAAEAGDVPAETGVAQEQEAKKPAAKRSRKKKSPAAAAVEGEAGATTAAAKRSRGRKAPAAVEGGAVISAGTGGVLAEAGDVPAETAATQEQEAAKPAAKRSTKKKSPAATAKSSRSRKNAPAAAAAAATDASAEVETETTKDTKRRAGNAPQEEPVAKRPRGSKKGATFEVEGGNDGPETKPAGVATRTRSRKKASADDGATNDGNGGEGAPVKTTARVPRGRKLVTTGGEGEPVTTVAAASKVKTTRGRKKTLTIDAEDVPGEGGAKATIV